MVTPVLFLVVSQALAGAPTPAGSETSGGPSDTGEEAPPSEAPAPPAPPVFDVIVVKGASPPLDVTVVPPPTPDVLPTPAGTPPPAAQPLLVEVVPPAAPSLPPGVGLRLTKGESWRVKDAADLRYTTVQFARLVGDRETLRALDNAREFGKIGGTALAITGGGLLVASLVVVTSNVGQPSILDYAVDPSLYEEEADYDAAEEFAQGQYDKSLTEWQSQRLGSTLFLVGTGAVVLAAAPFVGRDNEKREQRPELVYSRERAQQWVDGYNAAHPPVVPLAEPAPEAPTPEAAAPVRLELQPLVGFGFVGVRGSF